LTRLQSDEATNEPVPLSDMKLPIKYLQRLRDFKCTVIITDDLNLPHINWKDPNPLSDCSTMLLLFSKQFGFEQLVHELTRPSNLTPGFESIIDLVLCSDSHVVNNLNVTEPFSTSDHCFIALNLAIFH